MKAAIDIGTNTVLLLVARTGDGKVEVIHEEQRIPRLGKGVDAEGVINQASTNRVIQALEEYKELLADEFPGVTSTIVTATSAVRDAQNRNEFLRVVNSETGYKVRVLTGLEEAEWTAAGALVTLPGTFEEDVFVLDIGGGSTEIILLSKGEIKDSHSFDMGSVRFTERFLNQDPPYQEEIFQCREEIEALLSEHQFKPGKEVEAVGVAGTLTSLAAINLQLEHYDREKVNGHVIDSEHLYKGIDIFSLHTHEELLELSPEALKGREDVFLAGLFILEGFMKFYHLENIIVSSGGIRHGALLKG